MEFLVLVLSSLLLSCFPYQWEHCGRELLPTSIYSTTCQNVMIEIFLAGIQCVRIAKCDEWIGSMRRLCHSVFFWCASTHCHFMSHAFGTFSVYMQTHHEIVSIEIECARVSSADCHIIASFAWGTIYRIHFLDVMWVSFVGAKYAAIRHFSLNVSLTGKNTRCFFFFSSGQRTSSALRGGERKYSYDTVAAIIHAQNIRRARICHCDKFKHNNARIYGGSHATHCPMSPISFDKI